MRSLSKLTLSALLLLVPGLGLSSCVIRVDADEWQSDEIRSSDRVDIRELRSENRRKLNDLELGMEREAVENIMGKSAAWVGSSIGWIDSPYKTESYTNDAGDSILILSYLTHVTKRDNIIEDDELTPVAFKGGKLVGWGQAYVKGLDL
ncbi:MAG: DUF3192 domain-containing protein [Planctomycetota bacterium]